ncbi:MAG: RNA polymerase sigma factor [Myxococcota bacterium]
MNQDIRVVDTSTPLLEDRIARYRSELVAFLSRRVGQDAEELAQEVWLRIARASPVFPDDASFRAYAYTVARRLVVDHHRKRKRTLQVVPIDETVEQPRATSDPGQMVQADQVLAVVRRELSVMKPELAEVFRLRTTTGLSFKQIADRQGCSLNTALGRHHQATRRMARALREAGLTEEGA